MPAYKKSFVIIDNITELEIIEEHHPELCKAPLVLLSPNFSIGQLRQFEDRTYHFYDDNITFNEAVLATKKNYETLWNWFLDKKGHDLSELQDCSLGLAFAPSVLILLTTIFRYLVGLGKIIKPDNQVYITNTEDIALDVVRFLQTKIGFTLHFVDSGSYSGHRVYKNTWHDTHGRKRNLSNLFHASSWIDYLLSRFLRYTQKARSELKRVLLMPAGKLDAYISYLRGRKIGITLDFMIPFSRPFLKDFPLFSNKHVIYYYWHNCGWKKKKNDMDLLISVLKKNLSSQKYIDPELLIAVFSRHIFTYFLYAYAQYVNMLETLKRIRPHLVVLCAHDFENFTLAAQAAKQLGIATALTAHGFFSTGFSEYCQGNAKLFDYALAFGKKDVLDYQALGFKEEAIAVTSFPYFERFVNFRVTRKRGQAYKTALILPLDFDNTIPAEKIRDHLQYIKSSLALFKEMCIKVKAIKSRHWFPLCERDVLEYDGDEITLLSGYTSFPDAAQGVDIIVGPFSTAIIEASLMGIDYFTYSPGKYHLFTPHLTLGLFRVINVSFNMAELRKNILNQQPFNTGYSVKDLVELHDGENREDIYQRFENGVNELLNSHFSTA